MKSLTQVNETIDLTNALQSALEKNNINADVDNYYGLTRLIRNLRLNRAFYGNAVLEELLPLIAKVLEGYKPLHFHDFNQKWLELMELGEVVYDIEEEA